MNGGRCDRLAVFSRTLMRRVLAFLLVSLPTPLLAEMPEPMTSAPVAEPLPPFTSADFVDHEGHSRFYLSTRWALGEQDSAWDFELMFAVQLARGVALIGTFPVGYDVPRDGAKLRNREKVFFAGNATLGVEGGGELRLTNSWDGIGPPTLHLGAALDLYAPSAPDRASNCSTTNVPCDGVVELQKMRSIAPGLFLNQTAGFRVRAHVGLDVERFAAALELGLTPVWPLERGTSASIFFTVGARLRYVIGDWFEPFAELGTNTLIVEQTAGRFPEGPLLITTGFRFHIGTSASPAIFATFGVGDDAVAPIMFGIDIAGILRRSTRTEIATQDFLNRGI